MAQGKLTRHCTTDSCLHALMLGLLHYAQGGTNKKCRQRPASVVVVAGRGEEKKQQWRGEPAQAYGGLSASGVVGNTKLATREGMLQKGAWW